MTAASPPFAQASEGLTRGYRLLRDGESTRGDLGARDPREQPGHVALKEALKCSVEGSGAGE